MASFNSSAAGALASTIGPLAVRDNAAYAVACAAVILSAVQYIQARKRDIAVPAVGPAGRLASYYGAVRFLSGAKGMLLEGHTKYGARTFKVPELTRWLVVVNTPELVEEIRRAPDDRLSFLDATDEGLATTYTLGELVVKNQYHIPVVRTQLTRNIGVLFDDVRDEVERAFEDNIGAKGDEWVSRPGLDTVMQVVCRASNRVFVGLPLCRDKDYIDLNIRFTVDVIKASYTINLFPDFMKGLVGEFLTSVPASTRRGQKHLRPHIEHRLRQYEEHGKDWPDKPNDMLSWLMDEAEGEQRTVEALTQRILTLNFAAVHTSSMSFTHALFHLAARPEYIAPLREEIEHVVKAEGWSRTALAKMPRLDSFLREAQRVNGIGFLSMTRKARTDYTLGDGTRLPAGTFVACNAVATHLDERNYANARAFDGFRFARAGAGAEGGAEAGAGAGARNQMVSTAVDYLPFGHGRHACPGRFFAAAELKTMLAHLVLAYDVKLERAGVRPRDFEVGTAPVPDPKAHVLFRRRQT
ncbi:cytochrome P450 [Phellopilus nigrolimitatus]|nr:cytochrome P450 [Phellopilus nigrolimitatus]